MSIFAMVKQSPSLKLICPRIAGTREHPLLSYSVLVAYTLRHYDLDFDRSTLVSGHI